jgi:hypothetical protein
VIIDSTCIAKVLDPLPGAMVLQDKPHSTANLHKSDFLNLLDPRVDRNAARKPKPSNHTWPTSGLRKDKIKIKALPHNLFVLGGGQTDVM